MMKKAKAKGVKLLLPVDHIVANKFSYEADPIITENQNIPEGYMGMDIGPKTQEMYMQRL